MNLPCELPPRASGVRRTQPLHKMMLIGLVLAIVGPSVPSRAQLTPYTEGTLIIPMDLPYQDEGMLQAYGLLFALLRAGIPVDWAIDPAKTWHAADCDTAGDECAWDCEEEGSGIKCPYPTASPDFFAETVIVWDSDGTRAPGTPSPAMAIEVVLL